MGLDLDLVELIMALSTMSRQFGVRLILASVCMGQGKPKLITAHTCSPVLYLIQSMVGTDQVCFKTGFLLNLVRYKKKSSYVLRHKQM